ncbi:Uncharacterised protein [Vibrio cholerae]|nr:Uncharacterised protein [Vibrio cholerae]
MVVKLPSATKLAPPPIEPVSKVCSATVSCSAPIMIGLSS